MRIRMRIPIRIRIPIPIRMREAPWSAQAGLRQEGAEACFRSPGSFAHTDDMRCAKKRRKHASAVQGASLIQMLC